MSLPPELLDRVMEELFDADMSLDSCVLVCREWARIAYRYQHRRLHYFATLHEPPFHVPFANSPCKSEAFSFEDLVRFLRYAPMVCDSVETLHLEDDYPTNSCIPLDLTTLGSILTLLPRLQSLTLAVELLECRSAPMGTLLSNSSPVHLDLLELKGSLRCTSASILSLLSLFASVSQVVFEDTELLEAEDVDVEAVPQSDTKFAIESIHIDAPMGWSSQQWVRYIFPMFDPRALKALKIETPDGERGDVILQLTHAMGHASDSQLTELSFGWIDRHQAIPLDLSCCVNLRTLVITVAIPYVEMVPEHYRRFVDASWPSALRTLVQAPPSLQKMALCFYIVPDIDAFTLSEEFSLDSPLTLLDLANKLQELDWSLLDLAISKHPELEEVGLTVQRSPVISGEDDKEEFENRVRSMLVNRCFRTPTRRSLLRVKLFD